MFPNNPLIVEKLVKTKQEEIMREIQGINQHEFRDNYEPAIKPKVKYKMWVVIGLLIALAWLFSLLA